MNSSPVLLKSSRVFFPHVRFTERILNIVFCFKTSASFSALAKVFVGSFSQNKSLSPISW